MGKRRTGLHPLAYMGVEPSSPAQLVDRTKDPDSNNNENFNIGTMWINTDTDAVFLLTNLDAGVATWTGIQSNLLTVNADTGSALESSSEIDIVGSNVVETSGTGSTITVELTNGANGQLLIGGGTDPIWTSLTSSGGSVTITEIANGINLEAAGVAALTQLDGDGGSAVPAAGIITIAGGTNITTVAATNTVTINLDGSPSVSGSLTAGTSVSAGTSIDSGTTIVSGTTMTCGTGFTVSAGGIDSTGTTTLQDLGDGVVLSSAAGVLSDSAGNNGQILLGSTGASPAWASLTSTGGTVSITEGANTLNIESSSSMPWNGPDATTPVQMLVNNGYITSGTGVKNRNLPVTSSVGDIIKVAQGPSDCPVRITQNAGQTIYYSSTTTTTTGVTGTLTPNGGAEIVCVTADTDWRLLSYSGNLTTT